MSRRDAYHAVCTPPLSRIALKADALRSKSPNEPYLFRSKAQVRRHSGSISRACNAAPEQIRLVPTGVLSAAAPLDLFRFGVAKSLDDASGVACVFHLAKIEKSLSQNSKHQKIRHFDDVNPFHSTFVLGTICGNVTGFTYHAVFFDECFLIRKQLLCAASF